MPSPTPVGSITSQINSTANTTCNPAIPTGLTNGQHWMILSVEINGNKTASINTPTGWTAVSGSPFLNSASTGTLAIYYKKFATGDSAPSVTWTTNNKNSSGIVAYKDADLTTLLDAVVASGTGSSTTPTSPTATAVTRGATRLHIHGIVINGGGVPGFDQVERLDAASTATSPAAVYLSDQAGMAEGALGTRLATTTTASWVGVTLWLRPATATTFGLLQSARVTVNSNSPSVALPNAGTTASLLTASLVGSNAARSLSGFSYSGGAFTQTQAPVGARVYIVGQFFYPNNTSTGTITVTGTLTGSADNSTLYIAEWLGADTSSPLDAVGANNGVGTTTATVTTGSAAASGGILCLAVVGSDDASSLTADTNYILRYAQTSLSIAAGGTESRETTGGSTQTATFTTGNTVNGWNMQVACFKAASAGTTVAAVARSQSGAAALSIAARPLTAAGRPGPRPLGSAARPLVAQGRPAPQIGRAHV